MPHIPVPPNGRRMPVVRSSIYSSDVHDAADSSVSSARLHLPADVGENMREPDVPAEKSFLGNYAAALKTANRTQGEQT